MKRINQNSFPDVEPLAAQLGWSVEGLRQAYLELFSPFPSEKAFVETICAWLTSEGWICQRGKKVPFTCIDILATQDDAIWLIEVKNSWTGHACAEALGQLLLGAASYPSAALLLAMPRRPGEGMIRILARHHVTLLNGPWLSAISDITCHTDTMKG